MALLSTTPMLGVYSTALPSGNCSLSHLPGAAAYIHQNTLNTLKALFHNMLNNSNEQLSKVHSDRAIKYSINIFRDNSNLIEETFLNLLTQRFSQLGDNKYNSNAAGDSEQNKLYEPLVEFNQQKHERELLDLLARFRSMFSSTLSLDDLPFSPAFLVSAFDQSMALYSIDDKARYSLVKTFSQTVLDTMGFFYQSMNRALVARKITPYVEQKSTHSEISAERKNNKKLFVVRRRALLDVLGLLQVKHSSGINKYGLSLLNIICVKNGASNQAQGFNERDLEIIYRVGLSFERMIARLDHGPAYRSLLMRLQIPVMKAALLDQNCLRSSESSVVKMLDCYIELGARWSGSNNISDEPLFRYLEKTIDVLVKNYKQDSKVFDSLASRLLSVIWHDRQKSQAQGEKLTSLRNGIKEMDFARKKVSQTLLDTLELVDSEAKISKMVYRLWYPLMFSCICNSGSESRQWKFYCRTLKELIVRCAAGNSILKNCNYVQEQKEFLRKLAVGMKKYGVSQEKVLSTVKASVEILKYSLRLKSMSSDTNETKGLRRVDDISQSILRGVRDSCYIGKNAVNLKTGCWYKMSFQQDQYIYVQLSGIDSLSEEHLFIDRFGVAVAAVSSDELKDLLNKNRLESCAGMGTFSALYREALRAQDLANPQGVQKVC